MELISCVYDHVKGRTVKRFNMLILGWTDSCSFVPVAFNMMASADKKNRLVSAPHLLTSEKVAIRTGKMLLSRNRKLPLK